MGADETAYFANAVANFADGIQAFGANGFQVGTHSAVNTLNTVYHWAAFRDDGAGDFKVGTYAGNGVDNRNLDVVGFQPTILWVKRDGATQGVWRVDEIAVDDTLPFHAIAAFPNGIQTFRALGFQVGTHATVNTNLNDYFYVAFKDVAGFIETGTYTGDGNDNRGIPGGAGMGFSPDLVFVKGDTTTNAVLRSDSMVGDLSGPHMNIALAANQIQSLLAADFQVGTDWTVNRDLRTYYWAAWKTGSTGTTTTTTLAPTTTSTTTLAPTTTSTTTLAPTTTSTTTLAPTTTSTTTLAPTTSSTTTLAPTTSSTTTLAPTTTSTTTTLLPTTTTSTSTSTLSTTSTSTLSTTSSTTLSTTSTSTVSTTSTSTLTLTTTTTLRPAYTTPTHEQSLSLMMNVFTPDFSTGTYEPRGGMHIASLQWEVNSYSHEIRAFGGYWSAKFTVLDKQEDMESWLTNGLGRHIEVYDNALVKIWEGFVNQVNLTLGGLTATRGPLLDVANRVRVVYSGTNTETDPPVQGNRVMTAPVNDLESQGRYGIIEQILSAGGMTLTDAEQARDSYMAENALPKTIQKLGSGGGLNVSVSCLGYVHWLRYLISLVGVDGTINLDTKLGQVLDADPNGLFSVANSSLMSNTLQVSAYDNKSRSAWDVVKELVALGDEADTRYIFGVYADRHASYQPTNQDEVAYRYFPGDPARRIESPTGGNVWPWNVLPGGWMFFPSFLVGQSFPDDWRKDPRFMFIESVSFRLPHTLQLQGGRLDTIPQKLAKMGLAGIGA